MDNVFKHLDYKHLCKMEFNPDIVVNILARMTVKELFKLMKNLKKDGRGLQKRAEEEEKRREENDNDNDGDNTPSFSSVPTTYDIFSDNKIFGSILSAPNSSPIPLEEYFMRKVESLINTGSMLKILSNMGRSLFNDERMLSLLHKRGNVTNFSDLEYRGILFSGDCRSVEDVVTRLSDYKRGEILLRDESNSDESNSSDDDMESLDGEDGFPARKKTITRHDIQNACVLLEYVNKISSVNGKKNPSVSSLCLAKDDKRNFMLDPKLCKKLSPQGAYFVSLIVNSVIDYCANRCKNWQDLVILQVPDEKHLNRTNEDTVQKYYFCDLKHNLLFDDVGTFFKYNVFAFDLETKASSNDLYFKPSLEVLLISDDSRDAANQAILKGFSIVGVDIIMNFLEEKLSKPSVSERQMLELKLKKNFFEKPYGLFEAAKETFDEHPSHKERRRVLLSDLPSFVEGDHDVLSCNIKRAQKIERILQKTTEMMSQIDCDIDKFDEYDYFYSMITEYLFGVQSKLMTPRRDEQLPPPYCLRIRTILGRLLECLQMDEIDSDGTKRTEHDRIKRVIKNSLVGCTIEQNKSKSLSDEWTSKFEEINFEEAIEEAKGETDFTVVSSGCIFFTDNLWLCKT